MTNDQLLLPVVAAVLSKYKLSYKVLDCADEYSDTAAFCEHYNVSIEQAANTLLVSSKKVEPSKQIVCVVLGTTRLDVNKKACELMGVKKASFADAEHTVALTNMQIGGVTAIGIENLPIYIDSAVMNQDEVIMGGGNRTSKLLLDPEELLKLPNAQVVEGLANIKQ